MPAQQVWTSKWIRSGGVAATNTTTAGIEMSSWVYDGDPAGGATPTTWANPTNATAGALGQSDPTGGQQRWLSSLMISGIQSGGLFTIHDRLGHMGGMDGTSTAVQNVNGGSPGTITRTYHDPSGNAHIGNEIWLECYLNVGGASMVTASVVYQNENGVTHTGTCNFGGNALGAARLSQQMQRVKLASGDRGVQSVTSVQLSGSTGTVGNFGVTITHPLLVLAPGAFSPDIWSAAIEGDIEILPGACLTWSYFPQGTLSAVIPVGTFCFCFVDK